MREGGGRMKVGMLSVGWRKVGGVKKRKVSEPKGWRIIF